MVKITSNTVKYTFASPEQLLEDIRRYTYCLIYRTEKVEFLKKEADIKDLDDFLELRAFDDDGELRVVKVNNGYAGRVRTDGDGKPTDICDENHLLWGIPYGKQENGYTFLQEDRGTKLSVPIEIKGKQRAFIKVRNYLSNEEDTFEFPDYRLVALFAQEAIEYGQK